jgi:hypothetical protein
MWQKPSANKEPTSVTKMAIGCIVLGLSFIFMIVGNRLIGDAAGAKGSLFWPFACTLILTMGELYLSPIGLSLVTKVSPTRIVSMMMGMWFGSSFVGNLPPATSARSTRAARSTPSSSSSCSRASASPPASRSSRSTACSSAPWPRAITLTRPDPRRGPGLTSLGPWETIFSLQTGGNHAVHSRNPLTEIAR